MMYRGAAAVIISFWSLCAYAADWQVVADTKLGQLKLDKASVSKEGKYTSAVFSYEFKELQMLHVPSKPVFNTRQDDVLADCSNPSFGIHASRFYEDGRLAHTLSREIAEVKFNTPAPDTMALTVYESVCAAASKAKP
jgi:hypothetical protein